jgi:hypothetical protein
MNGVALSGCWIGVITLVLAGCSGRVRPQNDDGGSSGGTAPTAVHDAATVHGSGAAAGASGGTTATGGAPSGCNYDISQPAEPDPSPIPLGARVDLPVVCELGSRYMCRFSAAQLLEGYECSPDAGVPEPFPFFPAKFHIVGCGNETVGWNGGYGGPSETFSLSTGERVGGTFSKDTNFGPCNTFQYIAGRTHLDCPDAVRSLCVPSSTLRDAGGEAACTDAEMARLRSLPSRPECDCSRDPGIDPCFGPGSCDCWCFKFVPAARACAGTSW